MDLSNKPITPPLLFKCAVVITVLYYCFSLGASAVVTFFPRNNRLIWLMAFDAGDALYVLRDIRSLERSISQNWIRLVELFHRENPIVLYQLSQYALEQNDQENREKWLKHANELDPYNVEYRNALLEFFVTTQDRAGLKKDIEQRGFEGIEGGWTPALYASGLWYIRQERLSDALPLWRVAAEISPSWSHVWIEYAHLRHYLGERKQAEFILERCVKDIYAGAHCSQALENLRKGKAEALGIYEYVIDPAHARQ